MEADSPAACLMTCLNRTCECHLPTLPQCHKYQTMLPIGVLLPTGVGRVFLTIKMPQSHLATSRIPHHHLTCLAWVVYPMGDRISRCKEWWRQTSPSTTTTSPGPRKPSPCTGFPPCLCLLLLLLTGPAWEDHLLLTGGVLPLETTPEQSQTTWATVLQNLTTWQPGYQLLFQLSGVFQLLRYYQLFLYPALLHECVGQVCPIQDDEDGHLSYKLGDIIENETQRCE